MDSVKRVSIAEEFKKNPELKEEDLQHLRDWYMKQPHFPKYLDNNLLINCFQSNYFRLEPTKTTIENFLTSRTHMPEFFSNRDPLGSKEMRKMMKVIAVIPLEDRTKDNESIVYSRLIDFEPEHYIFNDSLRLYSMLYEVFLLKNGTIPGHRFVIDVHGITMAHALRLPPMSLKKYLFYLQEALPLRITGMHFLNTNPVMDFIFNLIKPFLKKELMSVLHFHTTTDSLAKFVPVDILPNETGGKAGPLMDLYSNVLKESESYRDYFIEEEAIMRVDESKRPGKPKTAGDLFGVEGSFKKLDID